MFLQIFIVAFVASIEAKSFNDSLSTNSTILVKSYNVSRIVPANITKDGKTYFFKYNNNNNQFRIYNRVTTNGESVKNATELIKKRPVAKLERRTMHEWKKVEAFLDEQWNYSSSQRINTTELPLQINPFLYNSIVEKATKKSGNGEGVTDITKIIFNKKQNGSMILNFNLGKMESNNTIDYAELHFYWTVPEESDFYKNSCVLRLYEVENGENDTLASKNPDTHKLLNVIYASKAQTGWQMFRISKKSIENWADIRENLRLLISLSLANQVNSTTVFNDTANETKWRTFLILRIKDEGNQDEEVEIALVTNTTTSFTGAQKYCSKKDFYIDFRKLHWNNFIIAPEGFMAYDCQGKCAKQNIDNFSNHLKMLTTFQDVDRKIRTPCCVPIEFYSLPIMFYDKNGNVVIKIYKNMIAKECGCR
ncbi:hypothetical protein HHI36_009640 [Cryptolaemus montrouzieri]|uniref:TGF-beta family profile domain-containing protein n=1 Tax=Cryptolaemus montrouzieri TaxID=559131 RepID=A0ABD2MGX2_9CUCU